MFGKYKNILWSNYILLYRKYWTVIDCLKRSWRFLFVRLLVHIPKFNTFGARILDFSINLNLFFVRTRVFISILRSIVKLSEKSESGNKLKLKNSEVWAQIGLFWCWPLGHSLILNHSKYCLGSLNFDRPLKICILYIIATLRPYLTLKIKKLGQ